MKEYLDWISDTFVMDIADEYGLFRKSYPLSGYDLTQMMMNDYDPGYGEKIFDGCGISFKMILPFQSNFEITSNQYVSINGGKPHHPVVDESYPDFLKKLFRFISKVYSYIGNNKLKLDWRDSTSRSDISIIFNKTRLYGNPLFREWIEIDIRFKIDTSYNWVEDNRRKKEQVHNMVRQSLGEDSDLYKKWLSLIDEAKWNQI